MSKPKIALVAGGNSGEYEISIQGAQVLSGNIDSGLFDVYPIIIRESDWYYTSKDQERIPVDKNDFSVLTPKGKVHFDLVFITIHGTPGEDGKLQGYFDLLGIPYTTSGQLACALTFNKFFCNRMVSSFGLKTAHSIKLIKDETIDIKEVLESVSLPVFVKPNKGGSSLGTSRVDSGDHLLSAIVSAFEHDDEVMIEEMIRGTEVTTGVFRHNGIITSLPVTEIVSKSESAFFDYIAKYKGLSDEITPARISEAMTLEVQRLARLVYEKIELRGVVRIDFIITDQGPCFLEANITPGMSQASIIPQQARVAGYLFKDFLTMIIQEALK